MLALNPIALAVSLTVKPPTSRKLVVASAEFVIAALTAVAAVPEALIIISAAPTRVKVKRP